MPFEYYRCSGMAILFGIGHQVGRQPPPRDHSGHGRHHGKRLMPARCDDELATVNRRATVALQDQAIATAVKASEPGTGRSTAQRFTKQARNCPSRNQLPGTVELTRTVYSPSCSRSCSLGIAAGAAPALRRRSVTLRRRGDHVRTARYTPADTSSTTNASSVPTGVDRSNFTDLDLPRAHRIGPSSTAQSSDQDRRRAPRPTWPVP